MKASDWLKAHPVEAVTLSPEASLPEAATRFLEHPEVRDIYVIDADGQVCGHLGFRRLAGLLLAHLRPTHSRRQLVERVTTGVVREHMDDHVLCMQPDERISEVFHHHMERRVEDIPVVDADRRLLGVIRVADLLRQAIDRRD